MDQSLTPSTSSSASGGARFLLLAAIVALALNLRPVMAAVGPLLDLIEAGTGMSSAAASLLTTLPVLMIGLGALSSGPLRRRLGERRGILLGALLVGASCLSRAVFQHTAALIASAVLAGLGIALIQALMPVVFRRVFHGQSGAVMALYTTGIMGGAAFAAASAAGLAERLGWAWTLAFWGVPALAAAGLWVFAMRDTSIRGDASGGDEVGARPAHPFWLQGRAWSLVAIMGLSTSAYTLALAWLPPYFVDLGETRTVAGYLLGAMTGAEVAAGLIVALLIGRFPDRRGPILLSIALGLLGLAGLVVAPVGLAFAVVIVLGLGIGAIFPLSLILAMDQVDEPARVGDLLALVQGGGYIIASVSPLLAGMLRDQVDDLTLAWPIMGLGLVITGVLTLGFRPDLRRLI